jgi:hypothetical protein
MTWRSLPGRTRKKQQYFGVEHRISPLDAQRLDLLEHRVPSMGFTSYKLWIYALYMCGAINEVEWNSLLEYEQLSRNVKG